MNPNLFPVPKKMRWKQRTLSLPSGAEIALELPDDPELQRRRTLLQREFGRSFSRPRFSSGRLPDFRLRIRLDAALPPEGCRLEIDSGEITCSAADWRGVLYAAVTLAQLSDRRALRCGTIEDWPDTPLRVCSRWLIDYEAGRRALDWGDGHEMRRVRSKIDFAMRHKINAVFFEGFSWERDKFPGYARRMRELNRYGALRNVALEYGGHGIGVGGRNPEFSDVVNCGFVRGLGGLNRRSYPAGELYRCMGKAADHPTRFNGSCRSNAELNRLKALDLADYVRRLEPRMLYIHHEDISVLAELHGDWQLRCDGCRRRWPDDRVASPDGAAGAMAHGMRILFEAVGSVKNPRSHYDAARDCRVVFVPPGYGAGDISDAGWREVVEMFDVLAGLLPPSKTLCLATREQFFSRNGSAMRIPEVAAAVHRHGIGFFLFAINGADTYINGRLFAPGALLNGFYRGSDAIFNFAGTVFQEAQEAFNAECCWNLPPVPWRNDAEFRRRLLTVGKPHFELMRNCRCASSIPPEIAAPDGFLGRFCTSFYGAEAGEAIRRLLLLGGADAWPLATLCCNLRKEQLFRDPAAITPELRQALAARWHRLEALSNEAAALAEQACRHRMEPLPREMTATLAAALRFGGLTARCVTAVLGRQTDAADWIDAAEAFCAEHFPDADHAEGDMRDYPRYLQTLREANRALNA
ncbi:MAG: glycoside hydrolase family 20 zincin-like fold domain-containing protein [Lentisphaeria bacterium]|nr:glycoside hydrolase family 20 zincin-like fold domain-containing protein [Lentisphaeria bacterium]